MKANEFIKENQLNELNPLAVGDTTSKVTNALRGAGGAVGALVKGQSPTAGAKAGVAKGKAGALIKKMSDQTFGRWNQKIEANPDLNTDTELVKFIGQFRKHAKDEPWPGPVKGTASNVGKSREYIKQMVSIELAAGEFGQKELPGDAPAGGTAPAPKDNPAVLEPGDKGTKPVTTKDPKDIPVGTQYSIKQSGGTTATYKWEGQQWTKLMPSGKFQGGQIKNDLAFKLYLSAVQQCTALAPISAEPVPTPAGTGGETEPGSTNSDGTPQVDANKDGKDDTTGEPIKLPPAAGADATPDPDDVNAQVDANKDGKDDKTGEPMKVDPAAPTEPGDPDDAEVMKNEIGKANKSAIQKLKTALGMK
jgi:hypothetical protein